MAEGEKGAEKVKFQLRKKRRYCKGGRMHKINIKKEKNRTRITLDNIEISNVIEYQLKSSASGTTELTLKLAVILDQVEIV